MLAVLPEIIESLLSDAKAVREHARAMLTIIAESHAVPLSTLMKPHLHLIECWLPPRSRVNRLINLPVSTQIAVIVSSMHHQIRQVHMEVFDVVPIWLNCLKDGPQRRWLRPRRALDSVEGCLSGRVAGRGGVPFGRDRARARSAGIRIPNCQPTKVICCADWWSNSGRPDHFHLLIGRSL